MKKMKENISNKLLKANVALGMLILSMEGAHASATLGTSVSTLSTSISGIPGLLWDVSKIFGIFAAWKAWDVWGKAQKGQDPSATPGKAAGWLVGGVGSYFLSNALNMGGNTLLP